MTMALPGALAGCAAADPAGGAEEPASAAEPLSAPGAACVDWVSFETPGDAAADAGAVLRGTVVERDGTARLYGVEANRWLFDVEEVLERPEPAPGGAEAPPELTILPGERISVVSTPESCGGQDDVYAEGDPLDPATGLGGAGGAVIILLSGASGTEEGLAVEDGGGLHLITPFQGVVTPAGDGALPAEWPAS